MKFRKLPVVIDAVRFFDTPEVTEALCLFMPEPLVVSYQKPAAPVLRIETLEGTMEAQEGDWIIKGVKGEFYPCKPDIFAATYEVVGSPPTTGTLDTTQTTLASGLPALTPEQAACAHRIWASEEPQPRHCQECGAQMWDAGD